jgi:hypothetical protein
MPDREDWMPRALCALTDRSPWEVSGKAQQYAQHLCRRHCEVFADCDRWAAGREFRQVVVAGRAFSGGGRETQRQPYTGPCERCHRELTPQQQEEIDRDITAYMELKRAQVNAGSGRRQGEG